MGKRRPKKQKIDTIEKLATLVADGFEQVDKRFEQVDKRFEQIDKRFEQVDRRFEQVDQRFESIENRLLNIEREILDIRRRIESLEERGASNAGFAKEIDHILARLAKVEEKVGIHKR